MSDLPNLTATYARTDAVSFEADPRGGIVCRLRHGPHEAVVALQGAHVLSWAVAGREQLWLSPVARLDSGKAVRGGIPICWPWFGPHPSDASKPAHGFVRTRPWVVVATAGGIEGAAITLSFATCTETAALWPHEAEARLTVRLHEGLSLVLDTTNRGAQALTITEALHTYFGVTDIADVRIDGLDGVGYLDKLDEGRAKMQRGPVTFTGEVDRIFSGATGRIAIRDSARTLMVDSRGSASAVVWNPWIDKSIRLGDMGGDDAYRRMVCVETANAGPDVVRIGPHDRHVIEAHYRVA